MAVIAIDLDGTLLRRDKTVSAFTQAVLRSAKRAGHTLIFATARNESATWLVLPEEFHREWVVCANGAKVLHERSTITEWRIPARDVAQVAAIVRCVAADVAWGYVEGDELVVAGSLERHFGREFYRAMPVPERPMSASLKMLVDVPVGFPFAAFVHLLPPTCDVVLTDGGTLAQIMPVGVDKATAVAHVLGVVGAQFADTVGFGDDRNDLPLLRRAGLAVAMDNAAESVKAIAHEVTDSNENDGVARWLQRRLLRNEAAPALPRLDGLRRLPCSYLGS